MKTNWLNGNFLLGVSIGSLVLVGPALFLSAESFEHTQFIYDLGNIVIALGFIGIFVAIIQKILRKYENALLSSATFFQASDKSFHRLLSLRLGFVYLLLLLFSVATALISWHLSSRFFWIGYIVWLFSLFGLFGSILLVFLFIINRLLWILTPYKSMLYKWVTFDDSDLCHECGTKDTFATYGSFSVLMKKNHSSWNWLFNPRGGYELWLSVCSSACRNEALKKYADSVSNL